MNTLSLNHAAMVRIWTTSNVLLASGLLFLLIVFIYIHQLSNETKQLNAELQKLELQQKYVNRPKPAIKDKAPDKAIETVIEEILLPWNSLFKALEAANYEGVQMLAIEPNPKSHLVRIRAVALDTESMMRYLNNLNAQKNLGKVRLISHELVEMNGQSAIELVAETIWNV